MSAYACAATTVTVASRASIDASQVEFRAIATATTKVLLELSVELEKRDAIPDWGTLRIEVEEHFAPTYANLAYHTASAITASIEAELP